MHENETPSPAAVNRTILERAMLTDPPRTVSFAYASEDGTPGERRDVEPYKLDSSAGMLTAFCLLRQATRKFRLARMHEITIGEKFMPRQDWTIEVS